MKIPYKLSSKKADKELRMESFGAIVNRFLSSSCEGGFQKVLCQGSKGR